MRELQSVPFPVLSDFSNWKSNNPNVQFSTIDYVDVNWQRFDLHPDLVVCLIDLMWPRLIERDGGVFLHARYDEARVDELKKSQKSVSDIEYWMNLVVLDHLFDSGETGVTRGHVEFVLATLSDMWMSRLRAAFPERKFRVLPIIDYDSGDFAITFLSVL